MSENTTREQHQPEAATAPRLTHKTSMADMFARVSITQLTLVVLVVIFIWQWLEGQSAISAMRQELAQKIAEMDGDSKANAILIAKNQDEVRAMAVNVAALEAYHAEAQNQRVALETLYNSLSISRDETAMADVEQLLLIAGQQLQLSGNVKAALIAMENADARLQRMERIAFNGLRNSIGQDIDKLRALPKVDVAGLNLQINRLLPAVDVLPLVDRHRPSENRVVPKETPAVDEAIWQKPLRAIWLEVKQLVRIENTGLAQIPLLPPKQEFFLRENLKMRLMLARLALLSRDQESYRQELKTAQLWTRQFFDINSPEGSRLLDELNKLASASINIELPDISASLQAVRTYRLSHENAAETGTQRAISQKAAR
ncbi:MAG: uroporphyrinogen-III C-methyltransferase [Gallionella sp.]|nr:uroporphyrinogen-III C-methyltransferase [Gallionella sp.]MDP1939719.1 uroporphyrinogen-III C-methyltransferase [Gallionella sp.]